ncbi:MULTISPECIES: methyltransferase domain-containing protein [unclassified Streptomyces]|uniref:SAM-dependent methyltransferase n=1 Tax=unclassified Streptomyces TaxID=2593676 RepID=UPI0020344F13|nr:methyltransferase domain-containing protein [Streptomyces sp. RKAG290]MCM2410943.1 methyltransferase domain-containing protein [Streptomyces sp. RKAG290]
MDLPRTFTIRESTHRIHNPITEENLATLGRALHLAPGTRILDLACGSGELLCTWAREHGVTGTGVDISTVFLGRARDRAIELAVADRVGFVHGDASGHVADEPVDIAACVGATWIGGGVAGTVALLHRSVRPGGMLLIGEPYWRLEPPDQATVEACHADARDDFFALPELLEHFGELGWDVVEMVLADQQGWDRYVAAQWFNIRRHLDACPDDELAAQLRAELATGPAQHVRYQREYLGWGVFVLMRR